MTGVEAVSLGTGANTDVCTSAKGVFVAQVHVLTGPDRRRRWGDDQKRVILAAAFAPGASVAEVARRVDVWPCQIYRWRKELQTDLPTFAEVLTLPAPADRPSSMDAAIDATLANGARVRLPATTPPDLAAAVLKAMSGG